MDADGKLRWQALSPLLDRALEMTGDERAAWLASLHDEDPSLATDLETLLEEADAVDRERFLEGVSIPLPPPASLAGQAIGPYTLVSQLGEGGMGSVWLGRRSDGRFEGEVAVKLLSAHLVGRAGEERFRREGSILARLTHPQIARLFDAGVSSLGQPYLILELVDGEPIDRYCDRRRLDVEARLRLFLDVLAAVAHAHANLIVHRDIKPSNVLVTTAGAVKLLDFGIAKLVDASAVAGEETALTRDAGRALTPEYAAPEQLTGAPVTTATDIYSLGVLLYLLIVGRHPVGAALRSPADLLAAVVHIEPARLSDAVVETAAQNGDTAAERAEKRATSPDRLRRLVRGDLDTIVAKALKKRPEERYVSVTALADDVRRYLDHEPVAARPDAFTYRVAKFVRRHALGVVAAAAVTLLLSGLVSFYTLRLAAERDRARREAERATTVSAFLTGLFAGADPYATRETGEPTVRELLDAGAERAHRELAEQPELLAEMLTEIGRVYQRLGDNDKAQPLLEQALTLSRSASLPKNERVARNLNDLGVLLRERGDYEAATPMLEQALGMRRRLLGNEHEDVAVTLVELARVYQDRGSNERAEPLQREALEIRRKVLGERDNEFATSLNGLASVLRLQGDLAGAESLLRQGLEINRKALGENHPNVSTSLNDLGLIAAVRGQPAAAESLFRQAVAISRESLGERHPIVATELNNLARVLLDQEKHDEAASALEQALRIARPALSDDHPHLAIYEINLARVHLARQDAAAAEPLLRHALQILQRKPAGLVPSRRRLLPEDDWSVGATKSLLEAARTRQQPTDTSSPGLRIRSVQRLHMQESA